MLFVNLKRNRVYKMIRKRTRYIVCVCVLGFIYFFFGVGDYLLSKSYDDEFEYPLNIDIKPLVDEIISGKPPSIKPINYYPYMFINSLNIPEKIDLLILVKSAIRHFEHRMTIRKTYGQDDFVYKKKVKTVFFLGTDTSMDTNTYNELKAEMSEYGDIVRIDFHDSYFNNTIKTMMEFRWAHDHCLMSDFYLFTDDDMYVSVENLLSYVYKKTEKTEKVTKLEREKNKKFWKGRSIVIDEDRHLFAGYVFNSTPHRHMLSKWRVSLEEYPFNKWPPYVTAGAYVLSNKSMKSLYLGSLFVKHFRFDDIYLGIVAKKVGIAPTHCDQFFFYKKKYNKNDYKKVIASHGFEDHEELRLIWNKHNDHL